MTEKEKIKTFRGNWETRHHKNLRIYKIELPNHIIYYLRKNNYEDYKKFFEETKFEIIRQGMSGCQDIKTKYEKYHITMSDYIGGGRENLWIFEKDEIKKDYIEWKEINDDNLLLYCLAFKFSDKIIPIFLKENLKFPSDSKIALYCSIFKSPFKFVPIIIKENLELPEILEELIKPVFIIYKSSIYYGLHHHNNYIANIEFIPDSFIANLTFDGKEILKIPKIGEERIEEAHFEEYSTYHYGENWKFSVSYFKGRKTLYIERKDEIIYLYESFKDKIYKYAIDPYSVYSISEKKLLTERLDDIVFTNVFDMDFGDTFKTKEDFEALKKENSKLGKIDITEIGDYLILFHPEHGYLELKKGFNYAIKEILWGQKEQLNV